MRFVIVHKVVSYLMVMTSTLSLLLSGELPPWVGPVVMTLCAASWFWESPRVELPRYETTWNILTVGMLAFVAFEIITGDPLIMSGVHFILFLLVNKLFNRRTSRDYLQLYLISFMQVIAGSAVDFELTYGVQFILYVVFGTWTLILFHLKREMEDNYLLKYGDSLHGRPVQVDRVLNSRKLIGGRFLLATSAVSLIVFLGSTIVFVAFPRIGFGLFFKRQRQGVMMSGFSDRIELGEFGVIKDDPTVVMRVEFPRGREALPSSTYWRGISFDQYDGKSWTKSRNKRDRLRRTGEGLYVLNAGLEAVEPKVVQAIYLEPMEARVLFGVPELFAATLQDPQQSIPLPGSVRSFFTDFSGDLFYEQSDEIAFRYYALSAPRTETPPGWSTSLTEYREATAADAEVAALYTQLPSRLDPRVAELARTLVGDASTIGLAVERVASHLRTQYAYSLNLKRDDDFAPLEDFLFIQKQGHCEYFSTALSVLLRTQGIATRNVNGFLGGAWNGFGNYLAVSQSDAHSWVEVRLPGDVWVTQDATPPTGARPTSNAVYSRFLQYSDALKMRWSKYIIEYDLQQQVGLLVHLRAFFSDFMGPTREAEPKTVAGPKSRGSVAVGVLLVVVFGVALYVVVLRRQKRLDFSPRRRTSRDGATELYRELLTTYKRLGFIRGEAMTAQEFAAHLVGRGAPALVQAQVVIALYERCRFGDEVPEEAVVRETRRALRKALAEPRVSAP